MTQHIEKINIDTNKMTPMEVVFSIKYNEIISVLNTLIPQEKYIAGKGGCCKKCEIYLDYKDDYQCSDDTCECHKLQVEEWSEELDTLAEMIDTSSPVEIRDWFKKILSTTHLSEQQRILGVIDGFLCDNPVKMHQQAMNDFLSVIKKEITKEI